MHPRHSVATRLVLAIGLGTTLVFALLLASIQWYARHMLEQDAIADAKNIIRSASNQIASLLDDTTWVIEKAAVHLEEAPLSASALQRLQQGVLDNHPQIYGSAVAFQPDQEAPALYAPYAWRQQDTIAFRDLGESYNYLEKNWFQAPLHQAQPRWSEPYFDDGGGDSLMTTYSVPFYRMQGGVRKLAGVVTADLELGWLDKALTSIKVLDTGYMFLLTQEGQVIYHPSREHVLRHITKTPAAEAAAHAQGVAPGLIQLGQRVVQGETGFIAHTTPSGAKVRLYYGPVSSAGWSLGIVFPENELFRGANQLTLVAAIIGVLGILLIVLIIVVVSRTITQPLRDLATAAQHISTGDFNTLLPAAHAQDEVGHLSRTLVKMQTDLQSHIGALLAANSARERIESELSVAHAIQMTLVPKVPQPFPGKGCIDLCATLEPAKEVGGDFYDWFWLDARHLGLVVADVSGKGVPAALFMAMSRTLLKSLVFEALDPAHTLGRLNAQLAADNEQNMFVTIFYAVIDVETRRMAWANAGHNPPVLVPENAAAYFLQGRRQLVVGAVQECVYHTETTQLSPGDRLLLYTDGVTEAQNNAGDFYGEQRLLAALENFKHGSAAQTTAALSGAVRSFSAGAEQSDDITVMAVHLLATP